MASGYVSPLVLAWGDGPTLTAASAASLLPITAKWTFPPNSLEVGSWMRITAQGRISAVVTTPGTARFDVRLGGNVIFDSGAMNLNTTATTTTPWWLDIFITARAASTNPTATPLAFFGFSKWASLAVVGSAAVASGGNGQFVSSVSGGPGSAPAVGSSIDNTVSNTFDVFFTQTVATGSFTCHNLLLETGAVALA
jgi:hypothetical protein